MGIPKAATTLMNDATRRAPDAVMAELFEVTSKTISPRNRKSSKRDITMSVVGLTGITMNSSVLGSVVFDLTLFNGATFVPCSNCETLIAMGYEDTLCSLSGRPHTPQQRENGRHPTIKEAELIKKNGLLDPLEASNRSSKGRHSCKPALPATSVDSGQPTSYTLTRVRRPASSSSQS